MAAVIVGVVVYTFWPGANPAEWETETRMRIMFGIAFALFFLALGLLVYRVQPKDGGRPSKRPPPRTVS